MILAWTGDELSQGQAQNGVNFDFEVSVCRQGGLVKNVFFMCLGNVHIGIFILMVQKSCRPAGPSGQMSCRSYAKVVSLGPTDRREFPTLFEVKFDLEGQSQSPPKTIGILTKVFYTYVPNLVILAWTGDELLRGQASAYRTHRWTNGHTNRQMQATTIPKGQNWPRVKSLQDANIYVLSLKQFSSRSLSIKQGEKHTQKVQRPNSLIFFFNSTIHYRSLHFFTCQEATSWWLSAKLQ